MDDSSRKKPLSHVDAAGRARMVGVTDKEPTSRRAVAGAEVRLRKESMAHLRDNPKGDVLAAARLAGIQAAKRTWELIPLCHPIALTGAWIELDVDDEGTVRVRATVEAFDRTGVEMEALVAASTAALTIYDMMKAVDRWITITDLGLIEKSGGRSGDLRRGEG
jgi:cyclic pyranopterin monophosphate synthase